MVSFETISELEFKSLISRVEGTVLNGWAFGRKLCIFEYGSLPVIFSLYGSLWKLCKDLNAKVLAILGGKSIGEQQQEQEQQQQATVDSSSESESEDETQTTGEFFYHSISPIESAERERLYER